MTLSTLSFLADFLEGDGGVEVVAVADAEVVEEPRVDRVIDTSLSDMVNCAVVPCHDSLGQLLLDWIL